MRLVNVKLVISISALASASMALAAGDPIKGKAVFVKCMICHTVEPGTNKLGPSLNGIVGKPAGSTAGFNYSPAMKTAKMSWTPANLSKFLANPRAAVPGTKMIFAGLPSPDDRANVIAYLAKPTK